jgi:hypothetical protein
MDALNMSLLSLRGALITIAVIGCSLSSVGAVTADADYYRHHHHHWRHRHWYYDRHHRHGYYRYD